MSFRYHLHYRPGLGITELGRAGRGSPGAHQRNNAASGSTVFNSVSERKQVFVGSTVLQHTKQDIFIDTLSIFFSEKQSSRGKCYWPWGKKNPEKSRSVPPSHLSRKCFRPRCHFYIVLSPCLQPDCSNALRIASWV